MTDSVSQQTEERLAKELKNNLQDSLIAKRTRYILLFILLIASAIGIAFAGFWMMALISMVLGLICLSQYFDANGSLHEVRRRSTRTIVLDFSVLRPSESKSSKSQSASQSASQ